MGLPICEVYLVRQTGSTSSQPLSDGDFTQLRSILPEDIFGQTIGTGSALGNRVFRTTMQGTDPSSDSYYALRRKAEVLAFEKTNSTDVLIQPVPRSSLIAGGKRKIRLAVFDMDSTLIEQEVIDELAREIGKYDEVAEITERAMRGELDFAGSLRERVALLEGLPGAIWDKVKTRIIFAQGARVFCRELKAQGAKMAVLSGGFTPLAEWVAGELGLDYAHANFLEQTTDSSGKTILNGKLVPGKPIVTAERKRELLLQLAKENGVQLDEVLCVGDGSNDLKMLGEVGKAGGIAIALKAKPKVQLEAPNRLNSMSMTDILYLLGYTQEEIAKLEGTL